MATISEMLDGKYPSKLPWAVRKEEDWNGEESFWIESDNGNRVADQVDYYPTPVSENDMRAIVRAVNAHDALVAALEASRPLIVSEWHDEHRVVKQIDAAIALARA